MRLRRRRKSHEKQCSELNPKDANRHRGAGRELREKTGGHVQKVRTMVDKDNLVLFSQLLKEKSVEEMIDHFVPLLHLANKQKLYLWQEKIFGDIFIYLPENGEAPPIKKQDLEEKVEIPKKTKVKKRIKNEREETG